MSKSGNPTVICAFVVGAIALGVGAILVFGSGTFFQERSQYVTYFDPRFVGVTGPEQDLQGLTRQLGILYIVNEPDESGVYLVDHTASVLLVDPRQRLVGLLGAPHDPVDMADRINRIRAVVEG